MLHVYSESVKLVVHSRCCSTAVHYCTATLDMILQPHVKDVFQHIYTFNSSHPRVTATGEVEGGGEGHCLGGCGDHSYRMWYQPSCTELQEHEHNKHRPFVVVPCTQQLI